YLYQPDGIGSLAADVLLRRNGMYVLKYRSLKNSNFGEAYIPVEVESFLFKKSGRDELGYFGPLEY
ncbi:MAG: hypothetical protein AB1798_01575, partial [Spirochaetota bacterium]